MMETCEHFDLIRQYVRICNTALLKNRERFPFKQIWGALCSKDIGQAIEVVVMDNAVSLERYVFHLQRDGVHAQPHGSCEECGCVRRWSANLAYLTQVTQNSGQYIRNPALLNWEWTHDA